MQLTKTGKAAEYRTGGLALHFGILVLLAQAL